jgi:hypothetical protein
VKKSPINRIIFWIPGNTTMVINTNEAMNRRTVPKTMILKKFSENDFSNKPDIMLIARDKIRMKK